MIQPPERIRITKRDFEQGQPSTIPMEGQKGIYRERPAKTLFIRGRRFQVSTMIENNTAVDLETCLECLVEMVK